MSDSITFTLNGAKISACAGQTIMEAADAAGIYIPRLCAAKGLTPHGSCRLCTVLVNGRPQAACVQPVQEGVLVESDTDELREFRRNLVEMLLVEGHHFCMVCERSGQCELQALAYRFGIRTPDYPRQTVVREVDVSHHDVILDHNRCILCGRCVRASRDQDGKNVFQFVGRADTRRIGVNAEKGLGATDLDVADAAVSACPVGALLKKGTAFRHPVGTRPYDKTPIGADIEREEAASSSPASGRAS